jgi:hypothetical protein
MGLRNETMVGVKVSIPLPLWNEPRRDRRERSDARQGACGTGGPAPQGSRRGVIGAKGNGSPFAIHVETKARLLPLARKQIDLLRECYSNNRSSLQDLLRARDQLNIHGGALGSHLWPGVAPGLDCETGARHASSRLPDYASLVFQGHGSGPGGTTPKSRG